MGLVALAKWIIWVTLKKKVDYLGHYMNYDMFNF